MTRALIALALTALMTSLAAAQSVSDADAAYDSGDVDAARDAYAASIQSGALDATALAHAHLRLGTIAAAYGDALTARAEFGAALAIEPQAPAPVDLSPDQRQEFEALRASTTPLSVRIDEERDGERVELRAHLSGGQAVEANVSFARSGQAMLDLGPDAFGTSLELVVRAEVRDGTGNLLRSEERRVARPTRTVVVDADPVQVAPVQPPERSSRRGLKIALVVVASVLVAGGVAAGVAISTRERVNRYPIATVVVP